MVADQCRDRTRMGDGRTAAPARAPPLRPALVAQPGAGDRQRAGVALRAGARADEADQLRPHVSGRIARTLPPRWTGPERDQYPQHVSRALPQGPSDCPDSATQPATPPP